MLQCVEFVAVVTGFRLRSVCTMPGTSSSVSALASCGMVGHQFVAGRPWRRAGVSSTQQRCSRAAASSKSRLITGSVCQHKFWLRLDLGSLPSSANSTIKAPSPVVLLFFISLLPHRILLLPLIRLVLADLVLHNTLVNTLALFARFLHLILYEWFPRSVLYC